MAAAETLARDDVKRFSLDGELTFSDAHFESKRSDTSFHKGWQDPGLAAEADKEVEDLSDTIEPTPSPTTPLVLSPDETSDLRCTALRVYNIPERLQSSAARDPFACFGPIEEWKSSVSPNGQLGPVTVRFSDSNIALTVYEALKGQDIYGCGTPTVMECIFTEEVESGEVEEGEADDSETEYPYQIHFAGEELPPTKLIDSGAKSFLSREEHSNIPYEKAADQAPWTNGLPPTCPRSMRRGVSPPPLFRMDSYRLDLQRHQGDSYRPFTKRPSYHATNDQRVSDSWRRRDTQRMDELVRDRTRRSSVSSDDDRRGLCQEQRIHRQPSNSSIVVVNGYGMKSDPNHIQRSSISTPEHQTIHDPRYKPATYLLDGSTTELCNEKSGDNMPLRPTSTSAVSPNYVDHAFSSLSSFVSAVSNTAFRELGEEKQNLEPQTSNLISLPLFNNARGNTSASNSPSKVLTRLMSQNDETSSMISGTTSSSRTSMRKTKCADCKNSGSDVAPLISCQSCPRKFHSCCGDPRPSLTKDLNSYKCGRCLRKERKRYSPEDKHLATAIADKLQLENSAENSFVVGVDHRPNGRCQTTGSQISRHEPEEQNLSNIQEEPEDAKIIPDGARSRRHSGSVLTSKVKPSVNDQNPSLKDPGNSKGSTYGERMALRYKGVTCARWKWGLGCRSEEECLFSHKQTGVEAPHKRLMAKDWTCYDWKERRSCHKPECPYAHHNTLLFIGRDDRPSLKHITCHWWKVERRCKYRETDCLYAHADTGVYAKDPSRSLQKPVTCSYWKNGFCRKSERDCPFSHYDTDAYAGDSGTARTSTATQQRGAYASPGRRQSEDYLQTRNTTSSPTASRQEINTSKFVVRTDGGSDDLEAKNLTTIPFAVGDQVIRGENHLPSENSVVLQLPRNDVAEAGKDKLTKSLHELASSDKSSEAKDLEVPKPVGEKTLDPRKRRRMLAEYPPQATTAHSTSATNNLPGIDDPKESDNRPAIEKRSSSDGSNIISSRHVQAAGMKNCELCGKLVLGTSSRCLGCTDKRKVTDEKIDESKIESSQDIDEAISSLIREAQPHGTHAVHELEPNISTRNEKDIETTGSSSMNSLKRHASDDHMFLARKRSKLDASLLQGQGQLPRNVLMSAIAGQKTHDAERHLKSQRSSSLLEAAIFSPLYETRRPLQPNQDALLADSSEALLSTGKAPSLEELIRLEKTNKGLESTIAENRPTSQSGNNHKLNIGSDLAMVERSYADVLIPDQREESITYPLGLHEPLDKQHGINDKELEPGLEVLVSAESDLQVATIPIDSSKDSSASDTCSDAQSVFFPSVKKSSCKACRSKHKRCIHDMPPEDRDRPLPKPQNLAADPSLTHDRSFGNIRKPCDHCRIKHKRCLHAENGLLDPEACRTFVFDRNGKPDPGRPRKEWDDVVAVANQPQLAQEDTSDMSDEEKMRTALQRNMDNEQLVEVCEKNPDKTQQRYGECDVDDEDDDILANQTRPRKIMLKLKRHIELRDPSEAPPTKGDREGDEARMKTSLQRKGVIFESDSESDSESEVEYVEDLPPVSVRYGSGAFENCRTSLDLFAISPELHPDFGRLPSRFAKIKNGKAIRPPKKQIWKNLLAYQCRDRLKTYGNAHWEVDRRLADRQVTMTMVPDVVASPFQNPEALAMEDLETRLVETSFKNFLGMPKSPVVCIGKNPNDLAFKEGNTYRDRDAFRGLRNQKRVTEEEKYPFITNI